MDDEEARYVIAHELGHIKCGHVLYKSMARQVAPLLGLIPQAGMIIGKGFDAALLAWNRRSEYSADRAALLGTQNVQPCISALMKLAGGTGRWAEQLSVEGFLEQARAYHENKEQSTTDKIYQFIVGSKATHPFPVERAKVLDEWVTSEQYKRLLAGDYIPAIPSATSAVPAVIPEDNSEPKMQIFVTRNQQRYGPYTLQDALAGLAAGNLQSNDLAWYQGAQGWLPLSQVPGIQAPLT